MEAYLKAGIWGVVLAFALNFLISTVGIGAIPPFLPAFLVVIIVVAIFKIDGIKEVLVVALMSYFFSNALWEALVYSLLYFMEPVQVTLEFSILPLIDMVLTPITSVVAVYLGTYFVRILKA